MTVLRMKCLVCNTRIEVQQRAGSARAQMDDFLCTPCREKKEAREEAKPRDKMEERRLDERVDELREAYYRR